ncbi:Imm1 family immunity protein [Actinoplanes sp. DH11]|uniref:Imm1 family immunity protein n=1 Tax=Actinoplanes sp. DH11 TaxID=2857011 RepID=UPI001E416824|nr:Imm1 family immunity protein [Actinoplanes sp. DH11]
MILAVQVGRSWRFISSREDVAGVVESVFDDLAAQREQGFPGEVAELTFARQPWHGYDVDTDNHLFISINVETGFGALTWYVMQNRPRASDIHDVVWVTDNPQPTDADPRVVADPDAGGFYHPRSAIPLEQVRAALVEFCATGTGDRPECVSWTPGRIDGWRQDEPYRKRAPDDSGANFPDPWASA